VARSRTKKTGPAGRVSRRVTVVKAPSWDDASSSRSSAAQFFRSVELSMAIPKSRAGLRYRKVSSKNDPAISATNEPAGAWSKRRGSEPNTYSSKLPRLSNSGSESRPERSGSSISAGLK
jgi:hypothetical protein